MKLKQKIAVVGGSLMLLFYAGIAQAQTIPAIVQCGVGPAPQTPCTIGDLFSTLFRIVNILLAYAWLFCIVFIAISGIRMIFAAGNEERVSKAKSSLTYAIVGFIIIIISFVIVNFVIGVLTGRGSLSPTAFSDAMSAFNPFNLK